MASDPMQPGRYQPELPGAEEDADIPPPPRGLEHDPLDEEAQARLQRMSRRGRTLPALLVVAALGTFVAIVWWAYQSANKPQAPGEVPVVEAEPGDVKVRPESEGGMDVPNQDKLIYEQLGSGEGQPEVERLLPPPEEPIEPPAPPPAPPPETAQLAPPPPPQEIAPSDEIIAAVPQEEAAPAPTPAPEDAVPADLAPASGEEAPAMPEAEATVTASPPVVPAPETAPATEAAQAAPEPAPDTSAAAAPAPQVAAAGSFRIQLASVKSEADANSEWKRLSKAHAELIGALQPTIQRADLGEQGVFYRVQGGPLPSREAAAALCDQLKAKNQACLVVKP